MNVNLTDGAVAVIDIGKTHSRLTTYRDNGVIAHRQSRTTPKGERSLDVDGIATWLATALAHANAITPIAVIVPVAHGAAAAVICDDEVIGGVDDYEASIDPSVLAEYRDLRDGFAMTGSPSLPNGLNLGAQLFARTRNGAAFGSGTMIVPWPQFWAWRLTGMAASEVTSLGCHTDLWDVAGSCPSRLAIREGWAGCLPTLRHAADTLGTITPEWAASTGISPAALVHVGLHDSNAALVAAQAVAGTDDLTVLATGTWFVAMRRMAAGSRFAVSDLAEARDCLVNVDVDGQPVPSARFMGGRELALLCGDDTPAIDAPLVQQPMIATAAAVIDAGSMALPNWAGGSGPFPDAPPDWIARPRDAIARAAAIALYAALVVDTMLDLVGTRATIAVEGRFAASVLFVRALATLRPDARIIVLPAEVDVSFGALRLVRPTIAAPTIGRAVEPLAVSLREYRATWRSRIAARL